MSDMTVNLSIEQWKEVPCHPGYFVNSKGTMLGVSGKVLKPMKSHSGHLFIIAYINKKGRKLYVHRAVLTAFVGFGEEGMEIRHLDGNPTNNQLDNLAWGTRQENADDRKIHGTLLIGERSSSHRLTERDVILIRSLHGTKSLRTLAKQFGVSHTAIRRAALGIKWSYLKEGL